MLYFDISCLDCGPFHATSQKAPTVCPQCGTFQMTADKHSFEIDVRFKEERSGRVDNAA